MNIKTFIAAAVVALTAACTQAEQEAQVVEVTQDADTQLNADGSVKEATTEATEEAK